MSLNSEIRNLGLSSPLRKGLKLSKTVQGWLSSTYIGSEAQVKPIMGRICMDNLSYKQSYHYAMLLGPAQYKKLCTSVHFSFGPNLYT